MISRMTDERSSSVFNTTSIARCERQRLVPSVIRTKACFKLDVSFKRYLLIHNIKEIKLTMTRKNIRSPFNRRKILIQRRN